MTPKCLKLHSKLQEVTHIFSSIPRNKFFYKVIWLSAVQWSHTKSHPCKRGGNFAHLNPQGYTACCTWVIITSFVMAFLILLKRLWKGWCWSLWSFYWVDLTNKIILITEQVATGTAAKDIIKSNNLPSNKGCKSLFHLFLSNMYLT